VRRTDSVKLRGLTQGVILLLVGAGAPAHGASGAHRVADFLSGPGSVLFVGGGIAMPALTDHHDGRRRSLRVTDAVTTAVAASELLKLAFPARRPGDPTEHDSFPSGHATAAFAAASSLSEFYPRQAPYWYVGAAAIGWSRVELRRHRTRDVLAGAALGYWVGKAELRSRRGLLLGPLFSATGSGLGLTWRSGW
jgi:membrane-associated phospholipid phosphatase